MPSKPLRIAFMGTPTFAVPTLRALIQSHHELLAVVALVVLWVQKT